ncbi:hypothetical protein OAT94_02540 [Schleiferiaceae bacterium]|nr:hypothetical protein [Schleiferiaceae bacterium]
MSIQWFNPMTDTPEGLLLNDVRELLKSVRNKKKADLDKDGKLSGYEKKRAKAIETSMHDGYKSDRGQRKPPNMPTPKGNKTKIDKTTEILQEMGIIKSKELKKYSQESSVENLFPQFQNVDGGIPVNAHGFTTNGIYPATNDGPKKSIVSETAKIPAYAQKGYTVKSSSLHMHYNDAGGTRKNGPNIDTIEQRLASLTKHAGRNNLGMIGEIEGLLKQVKDLIETPSN